MHLKSLTKQYEEEQKRHKNAMISSLLSSVELSVRSLSTRGVNKGLSCMKKIKLTRGKYALVDDADYEMLSQWKWYCTNKKHLFYALRGVFNGKNMSKILMHRLILGLGKVNGRDNFVDHINGNGLDNRRKNLRICTQSQNQRNLKVHRDGRLLGVYKVKNIKSDSWRAKIYVPRNTHIGNYPTAKLAAEAVLLALALALRLT